MSFAVDLILVLIVIVCAFLGYRKGFILSFFNFFGGLISFLLGSIFAKPVGVYISDSFLKPIMNNYFSKVFREYFADRVSESGNGEVLPSAVDFFQDYGLDHSSLQTIFQNAKNDVDEFIDSAVSAVSNPLAESVGYGIALILLFVVLFVFFRYVIKIFDLVAKLPVLNFANRSLGFLFGVSFGILLVIVFVALLISLEPFLQSSELPFLSSFSIEKTHLAKYLFAVLKNFFKP